MQGVIRLGDKTTQGGAVLSCSTTMLFGDIVVARKGDRVSCPEHGDITIVEGNPNYRDRGVLWLSTVTSVVAVARLSVRCLMLWWGKRAG